GERISKPVGRPAASPCASISAASSKGYRNFTESLTAAAPGAFNRPSRSMKPPPTEEYTSCRKIAPARSKAVKRTPFGWPGSTMSPRKSRSRVSSNGVGGPPIRATRCSPVRCVPDHRYVPDRPGPALLPAIPGRQRDPCRVRNREARGSRNVSRLGPFRPHLLLILNLLLILTLRAVGTCQLGFGVPSWPNTALIIPIVAASQGMTSAQTSSASCGEHRFFENRKNRNAACASDHIPLCAEWIVMSRAIKVARETLHGRKCILQQLLIQILHHRLKIRTPIVFPSLVPNFECAPPDRLP